MPSNELFLGGLSKEIRRQDLEDVFSKYGKITRCDIKYVNSYSGTAYGFLAFDDERDAEDALKYENGRKICGHSIVIEFSKSKPWDRSTRSSRHRDRDYRSRHRSRSRTRSRTKSRSRSRSPSRRRRSHKYDRRRRSYSRSESRSRSRSRSRRHERRRDRSRSRSLSRRLYGRGSRDGDYSDFDRKETSIEKETLKSHKEIEKNGERDKVAINNGTSSQPIEKMSHDEICLDTAKNHNDDKNSAILNQEICLNSNNGQVEDIENSQDKYNNNDDYE